ncbi:hypothetical protein ATANTOWER_026597 [Ataeniobius toweri]|uniref:Uncharacterized protein n=1 Tax=Ataeniobius toweri TaxID=208326 RepID=A0ABU7ALI0_9TELE|nr:hypothetical protein [Ataeniobius toweri]
MQMPKIPTFNSDCSSAKKLFSHLDLTKSEPDSVLVLTDPTVRSSWGPCRHNRTASAQSFFVLGPGTDPVSPELTRRHFQPEWKQQILAVLDQIGSSPCFCLSCKLLEHQPTFLGFPRFLMMPHKKQHRFWLSLGLIRRLFSQQRTHFSEQNPTERSDLSLSAELDLIKSSVCAEPSPFVGSGGFLFVFHCQVQLPAVDL